jgi:hypothetical protein
MHPSLKSPSRSRGSLIALTFQIKLETQNISKEIEIKSSRNAKFLKEIEMIFQACRTGIKESATG